MKTLLFRIRNVIAKLLLGKTPQEIGADAAVRVSGSLFEGLKIVGSDMTPEVLTKALREHAKTQQGLADAKFRDAEGKAAKAGAEYKAAMQAAEAQLAVATKLADADRMEAAAAKGLAEKATYIVNVIKGN